VVHGDHLWGRVSSVSTVVQPSLPEQIEGPEGHHSQHLYLAELDRGPAHNMVYHDCCEAYEGPLRMCASASMCVMKGNRARQRLRLREKVCIVKVSRSSPVHKEEDFGHDRILPCS
jgi:hypothetical protein